MENLIQNRALNQQKQINQIIKFVKSFYCACEVNELEKMHTGLVNRFSTVTCQDQKRFPYHQLSSASETTTASSNSPVYPSDPHQEFVNVYYGGNENGKN